MNTLTDGQPGTTRLPQFLLQKCNTVGQEIFRGFEQNRENIMSANKFLMIYLLRKYSK